MTRVKYYSIHDILRIKSNVSVPLLKYFEKHGKLDDLDLVITQEDKLKLDLSGVKTRLGYMYYRTEGSALYLDYRLPILNAKLILEDLEGNAKIRFTKGSMDLANIDRLIYAVIQLKLIRSGYSLVHAGGLWHDGKCILLPALGNVGKTSTTLSLIDDFKFMSDDRMIVSENGFGYSFPHKIGISPGTLQGKFPLSKKEKGIMKVRKLFSKLNIFGPLTSRYLGIEKLSKSPSKLRVDIPGGIPRMDKGKLDKVFTLIGGKEDKVRRINKSEAVSKILLSTPAIKLFHSLTPLVLYFYFSPTLDYFEVVKRRQKIVKKALRGVKCFEIQASEKEKYIQIIRETALGSTSFTLVRRVDRA